MAAMPASLSSVTSVPSALVTEPPSCIARMVQGKAVAVTDDGSVPEGEFVVVISAAPPQTRVDDSGKVVPIQKGDIIGQAGTEEQKSELGGGTSTSP